MKAQLHQLRLVYPPISNQEAEWLRTSEDAELWERLRRSNLYMIAQRAEAKYEDFAGDAETWKASGRYVIPGTANSPFEIDFRALAARRKVEGSIDLEMGPKMIRAWTVDEAGEHDDVLDWFTTEKILFNKWREHPELHGLDEYRACATYELLYVGISLEDDSFTRLVERAHEKRVRILSNETPLAAGSRVTDETVLFFFDVEPLRIHVLENAEDEAEIEEMFNPTLDKKRMVADAEKAFTNVLQTKYNTIRYAKYPRGEDGLHGEGLDRYGYVIDEDITFKTAKTTIRGCHKALERDAVEAVDMIFISEDTVTLVRSDEVQKAVTDEGAATPEELKRG
jgi:hypothetical protein